MDLHLPASRPRSARMEAFIGLTVRVTLRDPSTTLEGIVLSLSAEQGSIELSPGPFSLLAPSRCSDSDSDTMED